MRGMSYKSPRLRVVVVLLALLAIPASAQRRRGEWKAPPDPTLAEAVGDAQVLEAVAVGVKRLLEMQEGDPRPNRELRRGGRGPRTRNGTEKKEISPEPWKAPKKGAEWPYEGVYLRGGACPPGYRVGGTAIAAWSLLEAPGYKDDKERQAAVTRALDFIMHEIELEPEMREQDLKGYDVRGWGQTYAAQALLVAMKRGVLDGKNQRRAKRVVKECLELINKQQLNGGGWNYANRGGRGGVSPFMTGPTVQVLMEAKAQGFEVDEKTVTKALDALESGRFADGAFAYSGKRRGGDQKEPDPKRTGTGAPAGSAARSAVVETTLYLAGRGSVDRVRKSVDMFFEHWKWLDQRMRRHSTHIGPYGIAPYYFFFGHQYAGQAIEVLPEKERQAYRKKLRQHYWLNRDGDGTWNDRVFPRSSAYGTSTTILGLMAPQMELPTPWKL